MRRREFLAVFLGMLFLTASAAVAGIISGKITAVGKGGTSITVETPKGAQTFQVGEKLAVTLDDKTIDRAKLAVGMRVTVFTDSSNKPTKVIARPESQPAKTAKSDSKSEPEAAATRTASAKARKAADGTGDWPQYLGANRDNISQETGLLKRWPDGGPRHVWAKPASGLGAGYSAVAVAEGMIFTMGNRNGSQSLLAMDLETGEGQWEAVIGPEFKEGNGDGPRGTPAVAGGHVYALGARGELICTDLKGTIVWQKNILQEYGGQGLGWGICESVLIDGEKLICTPGGPQATLVALDRSNGRVLWSAKSPEGDSASYASAIKVEVGGVSQYVQFTNKGTIGVRADDGTFLWRDNAAANGTANCSSPQFFNDMVFSSSGYGQGGAMVRLTSDSGSTAAKFEYHTREMKSHHGGFVIVDGYIYGSDSDGVFVCLDLKNGQVKWQSRGPGKGSITCADGMLIVRNEGGRVTLMQASPAGYRELGKFDQLHRSGNSAWAYPVVAHGRLFLRDMDNLLCYDLRGK